MLYRGEDFAADSSCFPGAFGFGTHLPELLSDGSVIIGGADRPTAVFITKSYHPAVALAVFFLGFTGLISSLSFLLTVRYQEKK